MCRKIFCDEFWNFFDKICWLTTLEWGVETNVVYKYKFNGPIFPISILNEYTLSIFYYNLWTCETVTIFCVKKKDNKCAVLKMCKNLAQKRILKNFIRLKYILMIQDFENYFRL